MLKVGVLMGGISSEREVSLDSGNNVIEHLDKSKYEVIPVVIDNKEDVFEKVRDLDFALLMLHGKFGEDGRVQAVLETCGIPYSGCGVLAGALGVDKDICKQVLRYNNIRTADWFVVRAIEDINYEKIEEYGYPVMVKPVSGGGSVATFIVKKKEDVEEAVREGLIWDEEIMIEKFIPGATEITCPVVDGKMLPVLQIDPQGEFFDYQSKYTAEGSERYVVNLPKELHEEVERMAVGTYYALKTSVYTRVDMLVKDGVPYVLEVNTLPGMTKNSLYPVSLKGAGIEISDFLDTIIEKSLAVRKRVADLDNARNNGVVVKEK